MSDRLPISVLLLARDETGRLETLIPSLDFAREVVVVWDADGDPAARGVAERLGARVFERRFDGFGPQRQFALLQCAQPWVLWIDADERPDAALVASLREFMETAAGRAPGGREAVVDGVRDELACSSIRFVRRTWFLGTRIRFCGWRDERILRAFRRESAHFDDAPVHERVHVAGRTADLRGTLEHRSYETLEDCVVKMKRYARAGAEKAWRGGARANAFDVLVRPPLRFLRQYVLQLGVLDGAHGVALCGFAAAQVFLKYAALWDRSRRERARPSGGPAAGRATRA
ncbi:MAG: glycosyltransferase family 2 protein [Candidatus Eisenbacteria bacterium]|nr:glycosyltransferase family 2 protein [Candidatus Eisenbacteria bacterium]